MNQQGPVIVVEDGKVVDEGAHLAPTPSWFKNLMLTLLLVMLGFGPLAFGAVEPWSQFVLVSLAVLACGFWLWGYEHPWNELWSQAIVRILFGVAMLGVLQYVTGWTVYRHATWLRLQLLFVYAVACLISLEYLRSRRRLRIFCAVLGAFGTLIAIEAILQDLSGTTKLLGLRTVTSSGWVFGPYVNHSHFAGLMELLLPIPAVTMLCPVFEKRVRWIAGFAVVLMLVSLVMSRSVGGLFSVIVQALLLLWVIGNNRDRSRRQSHWGMFAAGAVFLIAFGLIAWLDGGAMIERVLTLRDPVHHTSAMSRVGMAKGTLHMFQQRPLLGWGLGTFQYVFPQFQGFYSIYVADHAHNDYLEWLAETGVIGFGLLLWFLSILVRRGMEVSRYWNQSRTYALRSACFLGCIGLLVHGLVDFNLQIPANAALFFAFSGVALVPGKVLQNKEP